MATQSKPLTKEMQRIRREVAEARAEIAKYKDDHPEEPFPFAKLKGVWKGKLHFTDAEIDAAKIRARDLPE